MRSARLVREVYLSDRLLELISSFPVFCNAWETSTMLRAESNELVLAVLRFPTDTTSMRMRICESDSHILRL
jgi:hypothetical protein